MPGTSYVYVFFFQLKRRFRILNHDPNRNSEVGTNFAVRHKTAQTGALLRTALRYAHGGRHSEVGDFYLTCFFFYFKT